MIKDLAKKAYQDEYLHELMSKLEEAVATNLFGNKGDRVILREKEINNLIRFADILSYSPEDRGRNLSYKILSLLYELDKNFNGFINAFRAILIRLGNFPGIDYLERNVDDQFTLPLEIKYEESVKRYLQKVPKSELTFTDAQYDIFERLRGSKHFSFSGPTSLGKSFIFESFIKNLILEENVKENIAILVPTRALINQTVQKLKHEFSNVDNYEILAHPKIPAFIKAKGANYIFVFTPERLISYISNIGNPTIEYLFIDEAQKVISQKDTRNPLYYHAILQAQKRSIKLFFASPNIVNPDIYLKLFDRSTEESLHTNESPVSQNKYFLDLNANLLKVYGEFTSKDLPIDSRMSFFEWVTYLSRNNNKSIVYCNSKVLTRDYALNFSNLLPYKSNAKVNELVALIEESVHNNYYLIDCLKKGVAFHFGDLPQRIRVRIETLFKDGDIDYLFCTSTLLEGVNLPVKNIFVISDKIGKANFTKIDFLNLIGRAGRLTQEFSGNILIVKEVGSKAWKNVDKINNLVDTTKIPSIESQVILGNKNFYENIFRTIEGRDLTRKNSLNYEEEIIDHYSNIALIHTIEDTNSVLLGKLHKQKPKSIKSLESQAAENKVPIEILKLSSSIKLEYQNKLMSIEPNALQILSNQPDYNEIRQALSFLYENYNWSVEEHGDKQILKQAKSEKHSKVLDYYAFLINSWMDSKPVSLIISSSLDYQHGKIELYDESKTNLGLFDKYNKLHVNIAINKLLEDIENLLRFRFIRYFNNYFLILKQKLGETVAGSNWAEFLEYGSSNKQIIELQNTGLPRHLAYFIHKNYDSVASYDTNGNLTGFDHIQLLDRIGDTKKDAEKEIIEFFGN